MTEILLKVALNTTTLTLTQSVSYDNSHDKLRFDITSTYTNLQFNDLSDAFDSI